jgi:hypothetical protein
MKNRLLNVEKGDEAQPSVRSKGYQIAHNFKCRLENSNVYDSLFKLSCEIHDK